MKVLDLQCDYSHVFEGWFASEDDFLTQRERGLIECPLCGDKSITKKLSAPRLNLGAVQPVNSMEQEVPPSVSTEQAMQASWVTKARHILSNTDDVGNDFAEEARKIHYGESKERGICGEASREETESLIDEGIAVMPFPIPEWLKRPLQ